MRARLIDVTLNTDLGNSLLDLLIEATSQRQAGDIAFYVSHEHRHAQTRETLCQYLERNGLACTGGSRNQTMAVAVLGELVYWPFVLTNKYLVHALPPL